MRACRVHFQRVGLVFVGGLDGLAGSVNGDDQHRGYIFHYGRCGNRDRGLSLDSIETPPDGGVKTSVPEVVRDSGEGWRDGQAALVPGKLRGLRHESVDESGSRNWRRICLRQYETHS